MKKLSILVALLFILSLAPVFAAEEEACPIGGDGGGCEFPTMGEDKSFREWLVTEFRPGYEATTTAWWLAGILAVLIIALAAYKWQKTPKKKRKPIFWAKKAGLVIGVLLLVYVLYSGYYYWYSDVSTSGLEVCDETGCRISMHWHSTLEEMSVCGKAVERPWETGSLSGAHTHKDNRIHLHTILEIDQLSKEVIDKTQMTLGGFFDTLKWQFTEACFKDTCDACNGQPAKTHVIVNGQEIQNFRDYIWKNGDKIIVRFD